MRGSLHYATDDGAVRGSGRDDVFWREARSSFYSLFPYPYTLLLAVYEHLRMGVACALDDDGTELHDDMLRGQ